MSQPEADRIQLPVHLADTEKMVSDIDACVVELERLYIEQGKPVPSADQLREQARCAWTYMTITGVLEQARAMAAQQRAKLQAERMARPPIILPGGRPR